MRVSKRLNDELMTGACICCMPMPARSLQPHAAAALLAAGACYGHGAHGGKGGHGPLWPPRGSTSAQEV
jgi:hypothetical protein